MAMLAKAPEERPSTMASIVDKIEVLLGASSDRFGAAITVPPDFPARHVAEDEIEYPSPSGTTLVDPNRGDAPRKPAPRLVFQAGDTAVLHETTTTLSRTAAESAGPKTVSPRSRVSVGLGVGALVLGGLAVVYARFGGQSTVHREESPTLPSTVPARERDVTFDVENAPPGLSVEVDGRPGALPATLPSGPESHLLTFRAPGFKPEDARVDGTRSRTIILNMQPLDTKKDERANAPTPPPPRPHPNRPTPRKKHDGFTDL
jgi:hypothetical protein